MRPPSGKAGAEELALISGYPPSLAVGGGIILRRLLVGLEDRLVVVCSGAAYDSMGADDGLLACEHRVIRPWGAPPRLRRVVRALNFARVPFMAARLVRVVRGRTVLLVPWSGNLGAELFLAGWLAAALVRSRLVVYELDDWDASLDDHQAAAVRIVGHAAHGRILRRAATTLAISPPLADGLHSRHDVAVDVLASAIEPPPAAGPVQGGTTPTIVFIGAVYGAQADAVARLLRCLEQLPLPVDLVCYTASTAEELATWSVTGPRLRLEAPVESGQVMDVLRQGSALFLPASFLPDQRHTVTTSLPTKTAEYLWSGVPVLVHGPPDSVVARLAREEGWGVVADSADEAALAAAVVTVLEDQERRQAAVERALATAASRHDLVDARRRIRGVLGVESGPMAGLVEQGGRSLRSAKIGAVAAARRAQIRLEGRLPQLSTARRDLAERQAMPYASHLPILLGLQRLWPLRTVLELGAGDFSTAAFLDRPCFPTLERLTSVEVNAEWRAKIEPLVAADVRLELLGAGHTVTRQVIAGLELEDYDLIFVDDSDRASDRAASISAVAAAAPRRSLVVVHDFEVPDYRRAAAPFEHVFIFSCFNPMTGVCWNGEARRSKALGGLAQRIARYSVELAADDRQAWIAALEGGP